MIKTCVALTWMKVKVNIINTWCISMYEAVTKPGFMMMMISIVSEESFTRDTYRESERERGRERHTHTHASALAPTQTHAMCLCIECVCTCVCVCLRARACMCVIRFRAFPFLSQHNLVENNHSLDIEKKCFRCKLVLPFLLNGLAWGIPKSSL